MGFREVDGSRRPKVVCHYLLERMRLAAVTKAFVVIRDGKWDIPGYLRDGRFVDMDLAYLMMNLPHGVPYTIDQAYPFVEGKTIALGFPDIIFEPADAFNSLVERLEESGAEVVLGLFPTRHPHKVDMVDGAEDGRIDRIKIKPSHTDLTHTWLIAMWQPGFTRFLHDYVARDRVARGEGGSEVRELFLGDVIQAAIDADMHVDSVTFDRGHYVDIGTPEDIETIIKE